jgi:hypothetical protein
VVPGILASFEPVIHALAGKLILGQGILPGADRPPTIFLASFINIFLFYFLIVAVPWRLELGAWSLRLLSSISVNKLCLVALLAALNLFLFLPSSLKNFSQLRT